MTPNDRFIDAAYRLAGARHNYAEAWLRFRIKAKSDQQATHQATVEMGEKLTMAEAVYELARRDLDRP